MRENTSLTKAKRCILILCSFLCALMIQFSASAGTLSEKRLVLHKGERWQFMVYEPSGTCIFTSSNKKVLKISKSGNARAIKAGTATVSVTESGSGQTHTCKVTVTKDYSGNGQRVQIFKGAASSISFKSSYLVSESNDQYTLQVPAGKKVSLTVKTKKGWKLKSCQVLSQYLQNIKCTVKKVRNRVYRVTYRQGEVGATISFVYSYG